MLNKLEHAADPGQTKAKQAVDTLLQKHNVTNNEKLKEELLKWKNSHH
jgi:hypothetical protein